MKIKEIQEKYKLDKEDFWQMNNKKWVLSHDAVEKIMVQEKIELIDIKIVTGLADSVRFLVYMKIIKEFTLKDNEEKTIISVGEADVKNNSFGYHGCVAEKRGIDRCVLKLINAYQYGIYSEVEANSFKKKEKKGEIQNLEGDCAEMESRTLEFENNNSINFFDYKEKTIQELQNYIIHLNVEGHPQVDEVKDYLETKIKKSNNKTNY